MNGFRNYFSDRALITILKALPLCMDLQWKIIDLIIIAMIDANLDFSIYTEYQIADEEEDFQIRYQNMYYNSINYNYWLYEAHEDHL